MAQINDLIAEVQQKVRKCPRTTVVSAYRRAARELCQKSLWLRWSMPGSIQPNKQVYNLGTDPQLEVIAIPEWQITMPGTGPNIVAGWVVNSRTFNPNKTPGPSVNIAYIPEGQFAVSPIPDVAYNVVLALAMQPTRTATQIPDVLLRKWDRAIESGALEFLYGLKDEPWYDPVESLSEGRKFREGWNGAKVDAERGYNPAPSKLKNQRFIV